MKSRIIRTLWSVPDHRHLPTAGPSETTSPNPSTNALRLDIQGLRAIAVLVVVANHLFKWPQGGYVGVDVFFVVSGYLITGLLLREHARTETISWIGFYKRRIKRIIPAAVTTIFVTCTLAPLALGWSRGVRTAVDGLWALFFVGNWRMYFQDTDYFQRSQLPSPLQHYWSLGVEEQFYTVWPWLLLALMTVLLKVTGHLGYDRSVTAVAITLIGGASFILAIVQTAESPSAAYFSSLTRAWELGVGVLVAVASFATVKIPRQLRPILAWAGIAGIIASVLLINDRTPFPGPWAAAPVLSTALVIAVGEGGYPNRYVPILTSGLSHYIGDLSYSIYLAHYPVIILLAGVINRSSAVYYIACVAGIAAASLLSFYGVENPVRKSSWLSGKGRRLGKVRISRPVKVAAVLLAAYSAVVITVVVQKRLDDRSAESVTHATAQPGSRVQCFGAAAVYAKATCIPLTDTTLVPSPVNAGEDNKIWWSECFINVDEAVMPTCHDGATDGAVRIALFGDSHAGMFRNALMETAKARGWQVDTYYGAGCRVGVPWRCPSLDSTLEKLATGKYNLILTTGFYDAALSNIDGGRGLNPGDDVAVSDAWKKLIASSGAKLVVIGDVPRITEDALACIKLVTTTADTDCSMERGPAVTRVTLDSAVARTPEAGFIDLTNIFCDLQRCRSIIGSAIVYADGASHLTDTFAASLGPYLADEIAKFLPSP